MYVILAPQTNNFTCVDWRTYLVYHLFFSPHLFYYIIVNAFLERLSLSQAINIYDLELNAIERLPGNLFLHIIEIYVSFILREDRGPTKETVINATRINVGTSKAIENGLHYL